MDFLGAGGEGLGIAGDAVVKTHAQGDHEIGLLDGEAGVGHAVHPGHTHG
jgi:hypothetical protein